jgi:hypothetical protein
LIPRQVINGTSDTPKDRHEDGLLELLRLRGMEQLSTEIGKSLYQTVYGRMQVRELDGNPPQSFPFHVDIPTPDSVTPSSNTKSLWGLLARVSRSCVQIQSAILNHSDNDGISLTEAVESGDLLRTELLAWKVDIPQDVKYQRLDLPSSVKEQETLSSFPTKLFIFTDIQHGALWIGYWCSLIHLMSMLRRGLKTLLLINENQLVLNLLQILKNGILEAVDDICASVPYMIGDIDEKGRLRIASATKAMGAFYLLRGLHIANRVQAIPFAQREWILDRLFHIGHARGIKTALKSRTSWLEQNEKRIES